MATTYTYTCDRCKTVIDYSSKSTLDYRYGSKHFDLCRDCIRLFLEFMKGN